MKMYGGMEVSLHAVSTLSSLDGGEWAASLLVGKSPQYQMDRRLGGTQRQSGHSGKEKKSLPGIEPWSSSL